MNSILGLTKKQLLALDPETINHMLTAEEFFHIAKTLDAFWSYDYEAAKNGKPGYHALLKSLRHSDGFFISRLILEHENLRKLMAKQMKMAYEAANKLKPDVVIGVPDGASKLAQDFAEMMGVRYVEMKKIDGKIVLTGTIQEGEYVLILEDFCTRGTGYKEAVAEIFSKQPGAIFIPYELVMLNRGGLEYIEVELDGNTIKFEIFAIVTHRIDDWDPETEHCPPCEFGSKVIKPKATDENWELITTSQK